MFISEKNLVVLSYDTNENEENILNAILSRLLMIMAKNVLPCGILLLGVGKSNPDSLEKLQKKLFKSLNKIQKNIKNSSQTFIK